MLISSFVQDYLNAAFQFNPFGTVSFIIFAGRVDGIKVQANFAKEREDVPTLLLLCTSFAPSRTMVQKSVMVQKRRNPSEKDGPSC